MSTNVLKTSTVSARGSLLNGGLASFWPLLVVGVLLTGVGTLVIGAAYYPTHLTLGARAWGACLLLLGGGQAGVGLWMMQRSRWSVLYLMTGVIYAVVGKLLVAAPDGGAVLIRNLLLLFVLVGVYRLTAATVLPKPGRSYAAWLGAVSLGMGVLLLTREPTSEAAALGIYLGVEMVATGLCSIMHFGGLGRTLQTFASEP